MPAALRRHSFSGDTLPAGILRVLTVCAGLYLSVMLFVIVGGTALMTDCTSWACGPDSVGLIVIGVVGTLFAPAAAVYGTVVGACRRNLAWVSGGVGVGIAIAAVFVALLGAIGTQVPLG